MKVPENMQSSRLGRILIESLWSLDKIRHSLSQEPKSVFGFERYGQYEHYISNLMFVTSREAMDAISQWNMSLESMDAISQWNENIHMLVGIKDYGLWPLPETYLIRLWRMLGIKVYSCTPKANFRCCEQTRSEFSLLYPSESQTMMNFKHNGCQQTGPCLG